MPREPPRSAAFVAVTEVPGDRAQHLVYLRQTRRESGVLAAYCAAASAISIAAWYFDFPRLLLLALFGIASYFGVLALINLWASQKHKRMLTRDAPSQARTPIELEDDVVEAGDVARHINLGDKHPTIRFVHMKHQGQKYVACVEKLYDSIQRDTRRFLQLFDDFKARCQRQYPDNADAIRDLKIDHMIVFSDHFQDRCVANVYFSGGLGEIWFTKYNEAGFADLIWA